MDSKLEEDDVKLWQKHEIGVFDEDLKPFRNDVDACQVSKYDEGNKCGIEIYVEPNVSIGNSSLIDYIRKNNKGKGVDVVDHQNDHTREDSSNEKIYGIYFYDSEEEKMNDFDGGFIIDVDKDQNGKKKHNFDGATISNEPPLPHDFITPEMRK